MKFTVDNRGKIIGALAAVLACEQTRENPTRFPDWARVVAAPILNAMKLDHRPFYAAWIEAGESDVDGVTTKGFDKLLHHMVAREVGGKMQRSEGAWQTAAEINEYFDTSTFFHAGEPTDRQLSDWLFKRRGESVVIKGRRLTLHADRLSLGSRTGRKVRRVFRVQRDTADPMPEPISRKYAAEVVKSHSYRVPESGDGNEVP